MNTTERKQSRGFQSYRGQQIRRRGNRDHRMDKRTNKTTLWGPDELVGAISAGASVLHCSFGTKTENPWFVTILWLHFHPHVADLEEIQVDPGTEPPKMLKHLFPWLSLYQDCIYVHLFHLHASLHPHFEQKIKNWDFHLNSSLYFNFKKATPLPG